MFAKMKYLSMLAKSVTPAAVERHSMSTFRTRLGSLENQPAPLKSLGLGTAQLRLLSASSIFAKGGPASRREAETSHDGSLDRKVGQEQELQARTPWHRDGTDQPPVSRTRSAGAMTKGKLLTTPSRLLKLILPLTTLDKNTDRKDIEPLALLVHPQQPLSYLERLIQSEIPMIKKDSGQYKAPQVYFLAEDSSQDQAAADVADEAIADEELEEGSDEHIVDGKLVKTGKIDIAQAASLDAENKLRGGHGEGGVETYSGLGHEASQDDKATKFVRWSSSTEIGDFIRDAARGKEFAVEIEGAAKDIRVGVPSFNDRTHYLRVRLRKKAKELEALTSLKKECDDIAHRSARGIAMGGFGILVSWWISIYYFTFRTPYGWDTMEPITYLAGLSTIMLGYLYFLWHNREVSYKAALHLTVSHRQSHLYASRGFDVQKWQTFIDDANELRKEIKIIANEYDVEWDETNDAVSETVHQALKEERKKHKSKKAEEDNDDDDEDGKRDEGESQDSGKKEN